MHIFAEDTLGDQRKHEDIKKELQVNNISEYRNTSWNKRMKENCIPNRVSK
jgi:hypothetical protein